MVLYGRKLKTNVEPNTQLLIEHIDGVVSRVDEYSKNTIFNETMKTIALIHDSGKVSDAWQSYLMTGTNRVPHSTTGVYLVETYLDFMTNKYGRTTAVFLRDILQYVVGSHHGLSDTVDNDGNFILDIKIESIKEDSSVEKDLGSFYNLIGNEKIKSQLIKSAEEMNLLINIIKEFMKQENGSGLFYIGVIVRMLLSMQIDADWSDAADFEFNISSKYEKELNDFSWLKMISEYEAFIKDNFTSRSPLNVLRTKISNECMENAKRPIGIYRLSVPTGGGKTIAALRFAMHHAKTHNLDRIFYIAPFNSILEQNAKVYKDMLGELADKFIFEHHSNVIHDIKSEKNSEYMDGSEEKYKYLSEKWTSPIILTSMVQLLNAFFSGDKKSIRRLHRIKNSVIIIDEMQSLPFKTITIFNLFLNAISRVFGTTFVLCTATQPPYERIMGLEDTSKKTAALLFSEERELVGDYQNNREFDRVEIVDKTKQKPYDLADINNLIKEEIRNTKSILLIANTRSCVEKIYNTVAECECFNDYEVIMLSNNMCAAHRLNSIELVRQKLSNNEKIIVISTILVEAGIDLDFEKVIRSLTGIDSIAQAAGRCNRNGKRDKGFVFLINIDNKLENTDPLEEVKVGQEICEAILNDFKNNPQKYGKSLLSNETITKYFSGLHEKLSPKTHFPTSDGNTLYDLLGKGDEKLKLIRFYQKGKERNRILRQSFKTAGKEFKAIEDLSKGIIVPYGDGGEIINELLSYSTSIYRFKEVMNEVQHFTVGIYSNVLDKLIKKNAAIYIEDYDIYILSNKDYYDPKRGLILEGGQQETFII